MAALRAAELELLFTANTTQVDQAEKKVQTVGKKIESKPIKTKIDADEKDALAGMDRVEQAAKKLVSADTAIDLDVKIANAERNLDRTKQRLEELEVLALGGLDVTADVRRAEANLSKFERQLSGLTNAKQLIEVDANTEPSEAALKRLRRVSGEAGAEAGDEAGEEFGSNIVAALISIPIAGAVIGVGVAAGKALIDGFNDGLQQEVGFDRLQALTGISELDAIRLGRVAGEAYANNFGESVEANMDVTRLALQFDLISDEQSSRSAQKVIESLSGIADVLDEDVRPVATAVTTLLRTGLAKSADDAFDLLATGAREGVNRSEDLLDTFTEYPVVLARLGLSGQEFLGLLNQGLTAGARNSDVAADALKEFQIRATDASQSSADGFRRLGLDAEDMTARIAAGGESAREGLQIVLDKLRETEDPVVRNAAAVELFGTKAEDLGEALFALDLSTAVDELNGVTGSAQKMFDTLADNDAAKLEGAQRNIEIAADGIKGALAAAFSEPLGELADFVSRNRGPVLQFMLDLANGAIDFGVSMVNSAADSSIALGEFVSGPLREAIIGIRDFIEWLPGEADLSGLDILIDDMASFDETTAAAAETMRRELIENGLEPARDRLNEFGEGAVALGFLNDASLRLAEALEQVGFDAEGAMLSLDGFDATNARASESGRILESQVRNSISALAEEVAAAEDAGEAQEALTERYNAGTEALVGQLTQMGLTEEQARTLIDTVLQTPTEMTTEFGSNAAEQQARVQSLADRIVTLPDGSIVVTADTSPASGAIGEFISENNNRRIRVFVDAAGGQSYQVVGTNVRFNHDGNLLEFMANGGVTGLTPMAPVAQMVPPNTWRVVGDRGDVPEAFIPLDGSPRSMTILAEAMRRMGVAPMANGGVVGGERRRSPATPMPSFPSELSLSPASIRQLAQVFAAVIRADSWRGDA